MDIQELNNQLIILQQNIARQKKLASMIAAAKGFKSILMRRCDGLKATLEKENADLLKLEKNSFSSVIFSVLGTLEKHIEKEKAEALAAKLKYDQALKDVKEVSDRIDTLTAEHDAYLGCQQKYDALFAMKRLTLIEQNSYEGELILEHEKNINAAQISIKEIGEAIKAGEDAQEALRAALNELDSAEDYSTWDVIGGGMISGILKHERIDEAADSMVLAQRRLERFQEEMGDVRLSIDISDSLSLVDIFFDNLFTDFMVHSRINDAQDSVTEAMNKVATALDKLKSMQSEQERKLNGIKDSLEKLITTG